MKTPETNTTNKSQTKENHIDKLEKELKGKLQGYTYYNKTAKKDEFINYSSLSSLDKTAKRELTIDLEDHYNLSYNPDEDKAFLFDYDQNQYMKLDNRILQEFLGSKENIRLDTVETDNIIKSTIKRINNNYGYVEFNNKLLNLKTKDYENKTQVNNDTGKIEPLPFITPKRMNYNILTERNPKFNNEKSILYTTLKQILGTTNNLIDFNQRVGSIIFNKGKNITIYYDNFIGNTGKSTLNYILTIIFGILGRNTSTNELGKQFNHVVFHNVPLVLFDETKETSFKNKETDFKKITGGGIVEETRGFNSNELVRTILNSHAIITTNELPDFNLNDDSLFKKISIIKLENIFTYNTKEVDNKKIFPINDYLKEELIEDTEGIEHIIYDSIKAYKLMKKSNDKKEFINKKGLAYARAFYFGNDHLINFLSVYVEITPHKAENTTPDEIYNSYAKYLKDNNIDLILDEKETKKEIGLKLNKVFGKQKIIRDNTKRPIEYKNIKCTYGLGAIIRYLIPDELEDYYIENDLYEKIFKLIRKGYNTFEQLKTQVKEHNNILKALKWLKSEGYIKEVSSLDTHT